jgi:mannose-6-phosphate isomerase-like protein (cupin superfamily)
VVHNRAVVWQTARVKPAYDALAPDGSEIRLLVHTRGGSMVHCQLAPGQVTRAVRHHSVEEVWFCVAGRGQVWRHATETAQTVGTPETAGRTKTAETAEAADLPEIAETAETAETAEEAEETEETAQAEEHTKAAEAAAEAEETEETAQAEEHTKAAEDEAEHRDEAGDTAGEAEDEAEAEHSEAEEIAAEEAVYTKEAEEIVDLEPGVALNIPVGVAFQFRALGSEPLELVIVTMPPWPGDDEAVPVDGRWRATS